MSATILYLLLCHKLTDTLSVVSAFVINCCYSDVLFAPIPRVLRDCCCLLCLLSYEHDDGVFFHILQLNHCIAGAA